MKQLLRFFLIFSVLVFAHSSLLQMSQTLWGKLLAGGIAKVGQLDPLRVPLVKIDQSEGNTTYRIILRNVEILGLNDSTLQSIHVSRGKLNSNLTEVDSGFVSYSDLRDLDSIRYKFHTLLNNRKGQNATLEASLPAANRRIDAESEEKEERSKAESFTQRYSGRFANRRNAKTIENSGESKIPYEEMASSYMRNMKIEERMESQRNDDSRYPSSVHVIYAQNAKDLAKKEETDEVDCPGRCASKENAKSESYKRASFSSSQQKPKIEDSQGSASESVERTSFASKERSENIAYSQSSGASRQSEYSGRQRVTDERRNDKSRSRLEDREGYIDIVYAEEKEPRRMKHFGNFRLNSKEDKMVYGLDDVMKDIRENERFIKLNFTKGQPLAKLRESERASSLARYAQNYEEKEGYFEEGMELIYHYGGMGKGSTKLVQGRRTKRAHPEEKEEDDVMHVIMRIRIPLLRVKSQYMLTGKVGQEILRGNGALAGNFSELVGDFSVELKKVNDSSLMVRATRAKLSAKDEKVDLQGMDERGAVKSILTHGLMAAEAVAAMLADDLATKALSEKTADAMVFRMYDDLASK